MEQWLADEVGGPLFRIGKQELSEVVGRRRPVLVGARSEDRLLDADEPLGEVFADEAGRSLLVLGEPGSGKSVLLRRLARDLLARVDADPGEPIPVLLDLAGWTDPGSGPGQTGRPFAEWLASDDGLRRSYRGIVADQFRAWLREGRLTLLLDGLDEVRAEHRAACVGALNAFVAGVGGAAPGGIVVTSRVDEYRAVAREAGLLHLNAAVYLRPLSDEQVHGYLDVSGARRDRLRALWEADAAVRELARNPLMLRTMSVAFEQASAVEAGASPRDRLLGAYVDRVFERAGERLHQHGAVDALPDAPEGEIERVFGGDGGEADPAWVAAGRERLPVERAVVVRRLGWLAARMREHAQGTFYVEGLQPSWLRAGQRGLYLLASRGAGGLVLGLSAGALILLGLGVSGTLFGVAEAVVTGGIVVALSLAGALLVGGLDAWQFARGGAAARGAGRAALVAAMSVLGGVAFWGGGLRGAYGVVFGLLWGIAVVVVFEPAAAWRSVRRDVRLVEPLRWSRRGARRAAVRGLGVGALAGAVFGGLLVGAELTSTGAGAIVVVTAVAGAAVAAVIGGALGGLKHGNVRTVPRHNLGFRLSIRNAVFAGAVTAVAAALVLTAFGGLSGALGWAGMLRFGLGGGLFCGLLAALRHGGLNAVYHATLRVLLDRAGHLPLRAAPFFRFAADLSLVRSAGGGYAFAHRLFAEYFADQAGPQEAPSPVPSAPPSEAEDRMAMA